MKRILLLLPIVAALMMLSHSCSKLSSEAKEIVGKYTILEISQDIPVMELNSDGSCVVRAIRPNVLTYSVRGSWNVERDSLVMDMDTATLCVEQGDSSLVGEVPVRAARKVAGHTDISLELEKDDVIYFFKKIQ